MKTKSKVIVICTLAAATLGFGIVSSCNSTPISEVEEAVIGILNQKGCIACHSFNPEIPFYAKFPLIGRVIKEDMHKAARFVTLDPIDSTVTSVDEVTLAKIEQSIISGSMPPASYTHVYWRSKISKAEKQTVLAWVNETRKNRFYDGIASEEFALEPIRPIPDSIPVNAEKTALGKDMYNDTRISLDNTVSCATCHILSEGGADHADERTSEGIYGQKGGVNSPTVYNAVFQIRQFWNGRAANLAEQAGQPPVNPVEMGEQTWEMIVGRLREDKDLAARFEKLYPGEGLTEATVCDAIAEYEKTLLTPDSPFDRYLKGDKSALTQEQLDGYKAFRESDCASCHSGILVGGASFEYLGIVDESYFDSRDKSIPYVSDDDGLKGFTLKERDLHRFKVPTLRNVALTPPYFHDGTIQTLEEATEAMMKYQTGTKADAATIASIVTFLETLNGEIPQVSP